MNLNRNKFNHLHLELDERLDNMSKGWLAGVEVRSQRVDQRGSMSHSSDSSGGLHHSLHDWSVVNSTGNRQTKWSKGKGSNWSLSEGKGSNWSLGNWSNLSNWSWSKGSEWNKWSWGSDDGSSNWDSLTNRINETILESEKLKWK